MNKIALAERLEGYSKVFATGCPISVDLMAMGKALRNMSEEKFASIIESGYEADEIMEQVESGLLPSAKAPGEYSREQALRSKSPKVEKAKSILDTMTPAERDVLFSELGWDETKLSKMGSEEDEQNKDSQKPYSGEKMVGEKWSKEASAAILQNLVRDVTGMNKSICCDTNRELTKEQMPDAEKKQQTPSSLKPDQIPEQSENLDSDMVAKAKKAKPVNKEAGSKKGPGIPDGTGPMSGTSACPMNKEDKDASSEEHEEKEEKALEEIAEGLEKAQEGLDKVEKVEVVEKAMEKKEDEDKEDEGEEKEARKMSTEEELAKMKKQKSDEDKAKRMEDIKKKSRPKSEESQKSAGDQKVSADGVEFEASMQDIDIDPEEQKKLASLFQ